MYIPSANCTLNLPQRQAPRLLRALRRLLSLRCHPERPPKEGRQRPMFGRRGICCSVFQLLLPLPPPLVPLASRRPANLHGGLPAFLLSKQFRLSLAP